MHVIERTFGWQWRNCSLSCCGNLHRRDAGSKRLRITLRMRRVLKLHHSCESISVGGAVMQRFMIKTHSVE